MIQDSPLSFGPDVVSRTLIKDLLFNGVGVVVGPGEIAYRRPISPLYSLFGIAHPLLVPRPRAYLVPQSQRHLFEAAGGLEGLRDPITASERVGAQLGEESLCAIHEVRQRVETLLSPLLEELGGRYPGLLPTLDRVRLQMTTPLGKLSGQTARAAHEGGESKIAHLRRLLWPDKRLQERALSLPWAEARFGSDWAQPIEQEVSPCPNAPLILFPPSL